MPWNLDLINQGFMNNLPNVGAAFQQGLDESKVRNANSSAEDYLKGVLGAGGVLGTVDKNGKVGGVAGGIGSARGLVATPEQAAESERLWQNLVQRNPQAALQIRQQEIAQQRVQQKQADIQAAIANPSAEAFADLQAKYPEDREAFQNAWKTRDESERLDERRQLASVAGYLRNGFPDRAKAMLARRRDAEIKAGNTGEEYQDFIDAIDEDPTRAYGLSQYYLAQTEDGDKVTGAVATQGEEGRKDELQPSAVREAAAKASSAETEAEYAPTVIESKVLTEGAQRERWAAQSANEIEQQKLGWEQLSLDKDKLATETQLKIDELSQKGAEVTGASLENMTKSVASAQTNEALADRTSSLADRFSQSKSSGWGTLSSLNETAKSFFGNQDGLSALRGEYQRLINSSVIQNLPPGAASDKDIAMAKQGFPSSTAGRDQVVSFLRGMSKLQRLTAQGDQRRADWISSNGNIGTAKRDLNVGGVQVPAGTTFAEFNRNVVKRGQRQAPQRDYLTKYGGGR